MNSSDISSEQVASLQASLANLASRLSALEAQSATHRRRANHPSVDRLNVAEAIADQIFESLETEKACTFEPNGRPCDHCSMCNSRGF